MFLLARKIKAMGIKMVRSRARARAMLRVEAEVR